MQGLKVEEIRSVPSGAEKCRNLLRLPDNETKRLKNGSLSTGVGEENIN